MKVGFNNIKHKYNTSFEGYKPVKSEFGTKVYEFNYPFDSEKYDCYLEIFKVYEDKDGNYNADNILPDIETDETGYKLSPGSNRIDVSFNYDLSINEPFAYRYKLVHKKTGELSYKIDSGDTIPHRHNQSERNFTLIKPSSSFPLNGGAMKLLIPDSYRVGLVYDDKGKVIGNKELIKRTAKSTRTFSNKLGGTLAGIEKDLDEGRFDGYSRIVSTPIFTNDDLSHHKYWNKNIFQIPKDIGNINNYSVLQKKLFHKGINWVADGAFVNEGLQGIHMQSIYKWGEKSPFIHWFRANNLANAPLTLPVLPKDLTNVGFKVVNPDDKTKPTYIQIFDKRLASEKQQKDTKNIIESYDNADTGNPLEINTYEDTVVPYYFEINPQTYKISLERLEELNKTLGKNKIPLDSPQALKILTKFENFELANNNMESGIENWDANVDIPKLRYTLSHNDTEYIKNFEGLEKEKLYKKMEIGTNQVQDYILTSAQYWTKKTNQILTLDVAKNLRMNRLHRVNPDTVYNVIMDNIDKGLLPKSLKNNISKEVIRNVLKDEYDLKGMLTKESYFDVITENLMNFPLEAIEFGDNVTTVLASPYITKYAKNKEDIGVSRYSLFLEDDAHIDDEYKSIYKYTNKFYNDDLTIFTKKLLDILNEKLPNNCQLDSNVNTSPYGKYVLPILTAEVAKFAVIKSLAPHIKFSVNEETGEISYDYKSLSQVTLQSLGIIADSPKDEAAILIHKIKHGLKRISNSDKEKFAQALYTKIKHTNKTSFKLAEMIVDRAGAGLDWRIDAAKDIADIDSLRNKNMDFETTWDTVTDFWKKFNKTVVSANPNAYIAVEVTDERNLYNIGKGEFSIKYSEDNLVKKFLDKTGMTAIADYAMFSEIPNMFAQNHEYGFDTSNGNNFIDKFISEKQFDNLPLQSLIYAYTFGSNHDKPRLLHVFAMDMNLFYSDLNNINNWKQRETAFRLLNDISIGDTIERLPEDRINDNDSAEIKIAKNQHHQNRVNKYITDNYDFSEVSSKSIAMAQSLRTHFIKILNDLTSEGKIDGSKHKSAYAAICRSISDFAKDKTEGFGVKPFDVTIDLVIKNAEEKYNLKLKDSERKILTDTLFGNIMKPAMSKLEGIMSYLTALPGNPTLFAGDDLLSTGYESKTKNIYLQNRSYLHNEWIDKNSPDYKPFVAEFYKKINNIMSVRSNPKLGALNDGAIYKLPLQNSNYGRPLSAILRQSTDGAMAISVFNTVGIEDHDYKHENYPKAVTLDAINLKSANDPNTGLPAGLKAGTKFINAENENDVYYVREFDGNYFLKRHENGQDKEISINGHTLILYCPPKKKDFPHLFNTRYNIVTAPYVQPTEPKIGKKLAFYAK